MRILGIDPGLQCCGYAVVETGRGGVRLVEAGTIRTKGSAELAERLDQIATDVSAILSSLKPDTMAVEELYSHYAHPRTAILMGHARGVILQAAAKAGIAIRGFSATKIKKSLTGNGLAQKQQMQRTIQAMLGLPKMPEPSDVADAVAVALCCANAASRDMLAAASKR
ncbi:MAG TPA: crossover junction endodeoxyribonuclease RuvC [Sedimentisphaerales bacterium]|nr:crossover junction endodeoxyribonuclease RuvC [Sedimentisphaerales bacterium]